MIAYQKRQNQVTATPFSVLWKVLAVIWVVEGLVMLGLDSLPPMPEWVEAFVDATLLAVLSTIPIWFWIIRPIRNYAGEYLRYLKSLEDALDQFAIVAVTDVSGKINYVNEKFIEVSGYSRDELLGKSHRIINSGYHSKSFFKAIWGKISRGDNWIGEIKNRKKNGQEYWVHTLIAPVKDITGSISNYISIRFDVTQRKTVETDLISARNEAIAANRAKASFLANMSHEIRTPLHGILGMASLLEEETLSESGYKHLEIMKSSGELLQALINDVLDFSKIEAGKVSIENVVFDLERTTHDCLGIFEFKSRLKGINLEIEFLPGTPRLVQSDVTHFKQILTNLVGNAVKFTEKGFVRILVGSKRIEGKNYLVEVQVIDSGVGIAPDAQITLFKSFSQIDGSTTRKYGGTGLGLAICKGLCEAMGGEIQIQSEIGKGSVFTFSFLATEADEIRPERKRHKSTESVVQLNVLVADDQPTNQILAQKFLEKMGHRATVVSNGAEAVEAVLQRHYDVVLMDVHMPIMDGHEATKKIHRELGIEQSPLIIALTASARKEDVDQCYVSGMEGFLAKPFSARHLEDVLRSSGVYQKIVKENFHMNNRDSHFEAFDEKAMRSHFSEDEDIMLQVIDSYLKYTAKYMQKLHLAIESKNFHEIEISAHTFKGAASHFFPKKLGKYLFELEEAGRHKNMDPVMDLLGKIELESDSLAKELVAFVSSAKGEAA